jgi:iron complex outermembrane receptor protein
VMVDGFVVSNFLGNSFGFPPAWGIVSPTEVRQFDIVYGPYSARYPGNSMGGIVNISTRAPDKTEAFGTLQAFVQPYRQYGTHDDFQGYSAEAGFALKPQNSPFGFRASVRRLRNDSQPQQFYQFGYSGALYGNAGGSTPVTGAYADPALIAVAGTNGIVAPVIGDYSSVATRQDQARGQIRFDSGEFHAEALFTYWWNREETLHPQTYLRDAAGNPFYGDASGQASFAGHSYLLDPATNYRLGIAQKNEWLAGLKLEGPLLGFDTRLNLSTLRFDNQETRSSNGYAAGIANGAGQLTTQGPTGWYTSDLLATRTFGAHDLAIGANGNLYETDQSLFDTINWRNASGRTPRTRTFGRTRTIGVFAEDAIDLGTDTLLTVGLRADWWRAYDGGLTARAIKGALAGQLVTERYAVRNESAFSPKLALKRTLGDGWAAELSLASATRFPTVGELFQGSFDSNGVFNRDSFDPNLRAEKSRDANLLVRKRFGPVTMIASVFYQRIRDAVFSYYGTNQAGAQSSAFKNIDVTRQYGAELIAEVKDWPLPGFDVDANAAWLDAVTVRNTGDTQSEGVQFPRIPRWRLNGNLRWRLMPALQAVVGVRYASRPNTDIDGLQRGDAYGYTSELFSLDVKANVDVAENLRLSAGVNNLTNDRAWVFHPYPQRTFLIEAGVKL